MVNVPVSDVPSLLVCKYSSAPPQDDKRLITPSITSHAGAAGPLSTETDLLKPHHWCLATYRFSACISALRICSSVYFHG